MSNLHNIEMPNNNLFTSDDIYQIYCSNEHINIMDLAILTKNFPQVIYKTLKPHFQQYKDLRGYREYRNFAKKQNELCIEIYNTQNELSNINSEIENLIIKKEELLKMKSIQKKEYLEFMNKVSGQEDDSSVSDYELEEE